MKCRSPECKNEGIQQNFGWCEKCLNELGEFIEQNPIGTHDVYQEPREVIVEGANVLVIFGIEGIAMTGESRYIVTVHIDSHTNIDHSEWDSFLKATKGKKCKLRLEVCG